MGLRNVSLSLGELDTAGWSSERLIGEELDENGHDDYERWLCCECDVVELLGVVVGGGGVAAAGGDDHCRIRSTW